MRTHNEGDVIRDDQNNYYKCTAVLGKTALFNRCKRNGTEVSMSENIMLPKNYRAEKFKAKKINFETYTQNLSKK